ncbi:hypothetical protein [Methylocystis echinoides]|jgi:hypothetical protein|uniref:hypothetical protein n=1 Tax=Methylocystis echinoides TaxID=29468 RepID=UPI00344A0F89
MTDGIHFTGAYQPAPLPNLIPGSWYIGFACKRCRQHFAILNALTAAGTLDLTGPASFTATCPACNHSSDYQASDLVQFQAAQGGSSSTA